ncbi:MAG: hypothetical protein ACYTHJ_21850 [Planctomycetota bacterium]|jgi:thiol:disulfide interchange protein DsbD
MSFSSMRNWIVAVVAVLGFTVGAVEAQTGKAGKKPKVKVDLLASVEAAVPGTPFDVAVRFDIEEDWHIYWINSGDAGMPPPHAICQQGRVVVQYPRG